MNPLFASLVASALASSAVSEQTVPNNQQADPGGSTTSATSDTDKLLKRYEDAIGHGNFAEALATASGFRPNAPEGEALAAGLRAAALFALKRDTEAKAELTKADQLAPQAPDYLRAVYLISLFTKRMDVAADVLDKLIARAPDAVRDLDYDSVAVLLQNEPTTDPTRNDDRRIALARIGYGGDTVRGHYIAFTAVHLLVRRGDYGAAEELLPYVREPEIIEDMLVERAYAPLWPKLEQSAGPHLQNVRNDSIRTAQRLYDEAPDDHERLANLIDALRHAGKFKQAIAFRTKLPQSDATMSSADEQLGWAVNAVALALHEAGRGDEADKLFATLNDAPRSQEPWWLVSMKINRLELLVQDGKFDRALPLIEPTANTHGTPYADQLTRRLRYCTLTRIGHAAEAEKRLAELMAHAEDAAAPTIDALLCDGEIDQAEALALAQLKNPDERKRHAFERDFVRRLQPRLLTADDPSVWQSAWRQLRQRPAIAAEFNRLGRDMPENFLPPKPDTGA